MSDDLQLPQPHLVDVAVRDRTLRFLAVNDVTEGRATALIAKEPAIREWIEGFEKPCVFWDIGANVGVHAIYAGLDEQVSVFAIEPNAANHYLLAANAELNGLGTNFNALCMAFSGKSELRRLCCSQFRAGASFPVVDVKLQGRKFAAEETVLSCTIDDFVKVFGVEVPQYVKIDVPTITDELIAGARETFAHPAVREIFVELDTNAFAPGRYEATLKFMADSGFRLKARHQKKKPTLGDYHFVRDGSTGAPKSAKSKESADFVFQEAAFSKQFVSRIEQQIASGVPQATLGTNLKGTLKFLESGAGGLNMLRSWGMQPDDVCVDYGCGSLRIGAHIIEYLQPGHYWGLDVTSTFYEQGLQQMDPQVVQQKQPNLRVIDAASLNAARDQKPTYMLCVGVVSHIPPDELAIFFDQVFWIMNPDTKFYLKFRTAEKEARLSTISWAQDRNRIARLIAERGGVWESLSCKQVTKAGVTMDDQWWCIRRPG